VAWGLTDSKIIEAGPAQCLLRGERSKVPWHQIRIQGMPRQARYSAGISEHNMIQPNSVDSSVREGFDSVGEATGGASNTVLQ
jgi:hypothetical protein